MPPHQVKSINHAQLENGTYEYIVSHLERELELNDLETPVEIEMKTVTKHVTIHNPEERETPADIPPQQATIVQTAVNSEERRSKPIATKTVLEITIKTNTKTNSNPNYKNSKISNANNTNHQNDKKPETVCPHCETCLKIN